MKRLFGLLVLIWLGTVAMDAQSDAGVDLLFYADVMSNAELPESRMRAQKQFRKLLLEELQSGAVTEYDSIPWLQSIVPADSSFRLFTWQLEQTAGDFKYFGVIDLSGGQLVELQDKRKLNSEFSKYDQATWYGALYYGIESFQQEDGTTAHMLLGYNANDLATNIKVADIMTLNGDKVSFGAPVFKNLTDNGEEVKNRIIMEYADAAAGRMQFDRERAMLIYDHVILVNAGPQGPIWVPDGSFHAYEFKGGVWNFVDKVFNEAVDTPPGEGLKQDVPRDILGRKKN